MLFYSVVSFVCVCVFCIYREIYEYFYKFFVIINNNFKGFLENVLVEVGKVVMSSNVFIEVLQGKSVIEIDYNISIKECVDMFMFNIMVDMIKRMVWREEENLVMIVQKQVRDMG